MSATELSTETVCTKAQTPWIIHSFIARLKQSNRLDVLVLITLDTSNLRGAKVHK